MAELLVNGHFLHQRLTGVQRYAREVLKAFDECGYTYTLLRPSGLFAAHKFGHHFWEQIVLPGRLDKDQILWSPTNSGPVFAGNHVITLHDASVFLHPEWFSTPYVHWKKMVIPPLVSRARIVITVSEFSKSVICKTLKLDPEQVKVVYNGVDTGKFRPQSEIKIKAVREKYGLRGPYLLTLGSLDPRKNFGRLVQAWKACAEKDSVGDHTLAIVGGGGSNFGKIEISESDHVKLLGYVDDEDLPALYSDAVAFLLPSLFEGFGLPVLEAMACGTPVLTSNTSALDEISGEAAVKVRPENADSIREGILQLLESPALRCRLKDLGFERVKSFDWKQSASAIYRYLTDNEV